MSRFFLFKLIAFFLQWFCLSDWFWKMSLCASLLSVQEGWLRFFVEGPFKLVAPLSDLSGGAALWLPSKGGGDNPATCAAHDVLLLPSDSLPLLLFCCNLILPCCSSYSPIYCVGCMYNVQCTSSMLVTPAPRQAVSLDRSYNPCKPCSPSASKSGIRFQELMK